MSTYILELRNPITLDTPQGKAEAYFLADYGFDADTLWGCFVRKTRQFWWFSNKSILIEQNISIGRLKEEAEQVPSCVNPHRIYKGRHTWQAPKAKQEKQKSLK